MAKTTFKDNSFAMLKLAISSLKPGETGLVFSSEEERIENYQNLLKLIQLHTDLEYKTNRVPEGFKITRIK